MEERAHIFKKEEYKIERKEDITNGHYMESTKLVLLNFALPTLENGGTGSLVCSFGQYQSMLTLNNNDLRSLSKKNTQEYLTKLFNNGEHPKDKNYLFLVFNSYNQFVDKQTFKDFIKVLHSGLTAYQKAVDSFRSSLGAVGFKYNEEHEGFELLTLPKSLWMNVFNYLKSQEEKQFHKGGGLEFRVHGDKIQLFTNSELRDVYTVQVVEAENNYAEYNQQTYDSQLLLIWKVKERYFDFDDDWSVKNTKDWLEQYLIPKVKRSSSIKANTSHGVFNWKRFHRFYNKVN